MQAPTNTRRLVFLGLLIAFTLVVVFLLRRPPPPALKAEPFRNLHVYWASQSFVPIRTNAAFWARILALPIRSMYSLTEQQRARLHSAVYDFLMAFNLDSYRAYRRWRTPPGSTVGFNMEQVRRLARALRIDWINATKRMPSDPEAIFHKFWEIVYVNKYVPNPAAIVGSTIGKALWSGVSLTSSNTHISVERLTTPEIPDYVQYPTAGASTYPSSFRFTPSPEQILSEHKPLLVATVRVLIKYAKPEVPSPAFCKFYWDPHGQNWVPVKLEIGVSGLKRTRDLVF